MSIIAPSPAPVQPTIPGQADTTDHRRRFGPSRADLDAYSAMLAERDEPGMALDEPTPGIILDYDAGLAPWWVTLPTSPELDTPIGLGDGPEPEEKVRSEKVRATVAELVSRAGAVWAREGEQAVRAKASKFSPEADRYPV